MDLPNPVIVVPGITATTLQDQYPLPPQNIWTVLKKDYERVALHPDNVGYEATEPSRVVPDQVFEVAYRELIEELRFNLSPNPEAPVPVFPFGYDWRQPLAQTERELAGFVDEVLERASLLRHYHKAGFSKAPRVSLIGHSMGGGWLSPAIWHVTAKKRPPTRWLPWPRPIADPLKRLSR